MPPSPHTKRLDDNPIETGNAPFSKQHGAVLEFLGVVREMEAGKQLEAIRYSCYEPMAWSIIDKVVNKAQQIHGDHGLYFHHRLGRVAVTEPSVIIRVATRHSQQAFELCQFYLTAVKKELPIWKEPVFAENAMPAVSSS